jgi:hypothetical protein
MRPDNHLRHVLLNGAFSFISRPEPVAGDLRMSWGIAILLLCLVNSRGAKASFQKLQFLAHSVRVKEGREDVESLLAGRLHPSDVSVRVEPWLNRAVSFAYALKFVSVDKGKSVRLTDSGKVMAKSLMTKSDALLDEQAFLSRVTPRLTDKLIEKIWRMEDLI